MSEYVQLAEVYAGRMYEDHLRIGVPVVQEFARSGAEKRSEILSEVDAFLGACSVSELVVCADQVDRLNTAAANLGVEGIDFEHVDPFAVAVQKRMSQQEPSGALDAVSRRLDATRRLFLK